MRRIVIILIGIALVAVLLFVLTMRRSPFGKRNTSFASVPRQEITRIVFSQEDEQLTLENRDGKWLLNHELETRKSSISYITGILKGMAIKSPVSAEMFDTAIQKRNVVPVRVRTFENRKLLSDFLVYKTKSNIYGNIMKKSERSKPFIVYVPDHEGDIGSAFTLNELYWQPYTIFNLLPSEIKSISFKNCTDTASSFSIHAKNADYSLFVADKQVTGWDTALVKRYLTYFTFIPFESWAIDLDSQAYKMVVAGQPAYRIEIETSGSGKRILTLWARTKTDGTPDSDRIYGKTDAADALFIVRYFDIDPILKNPGYFFRKE